MVDIKQKSPKFNKMNFGLILAGMAGFEPAQCQSQSLVPYRLATPHRVTFRIILLINVYVKI